jgi:hypothetical protein
VVGVEIVEIVGDDGKVGEGVAVGTGDAVYDMVGERLTSLPAVLAGVLCSGVLAHAATHPILIKINIESRRKRFFFIHRILR